jgi:hypothetical protein
VTVQTADKLEWDPLVVKAKEVKLLDVNAHFMPRDVFNRLVENIKRDGKLLSVPLCVREQDGAIRVISGNHRVMAAQKAGLDEIDVMVLRGEIDEGRQKAIQLAMNKLVGQDDATILKELYDAIQSIDLKGYSGFDDKELGNLADASPSLTAFSGSVKILQFLLVPAWVDEATNILLEIQTVAAPGGTALLGVNSEWEKVVDTISEVCKRTEVKSAAVGLVIAMELIRRHMDEVPELAVELVTAAAYTPEKPERGVEKEVKAN